VSTTPDIRICFVGDSMVAGIGDPEHLGWVGRVCKSAAAQGIVLSAYNLGVRRQTSADIAQRWAQECASRLPESCATRVVFSFGVNDTTQENGQTRVSTQDSEHKHENILADATKRYRVLVIGPPPIDDAAHNQRTQALSERFNAICGKLDVPYLPMFEALSANKVWMQQVSILDGAHPQAEGYAEFSKHVLAWPQWWFRS